MPLFTEVETISSSRKFNRQRLEHLHQAPQSRLPLLENQEPFRAQKLQQRRIMPWVASHLANLEFHLYTIWLFTASDLKTIIGPKTAFGIVHAVWADGFGIPSLPLSLIIYRLPLVVFWCWINLLPFAISNQVQDAAIIEDRLNKPWRPLPSGRLSQRQAKFLMFILYPIAIFASSRIGGLYQSLALIALGYLYNDCGGADVSCITRNLINGAGFICYTWGAMSTALGAQFTLTSSLIRWFSIIFMVVSTSVHSQDMYDQEGDSLRNRHTVPLVIGDGPSRWTIAISVGVWGVFCPWFNGIGNVYFVPYILSIIIMYRTLSNRSVKEDKVTFRLWNLWMITLYLCPVVSSRY